MKRRLQDTFDKIHTEHELKTALWNFWHILQMDTEIKKQFRSNGWLLLLHVLYC